MRRAAALSSVTERFEVWVGRQSQMSASGALRRPSIPGQPEGGAQAFLWLGAKAGGQWGRGSC